jgi:3-oxocholest-4-en-26-oyl-CoA dehydrogenase alpha subunit
MEFAFTDEQKQFRHDVRSFCREVVTPKLLDDVRRSGVEHSADLHRQLAARGWLGVDYPVEYDGLGLDQVTAGILREEMAYATAPTTAIEVNNIISQSLLLLGDEQQKSEHVPAVVSGARMFCMGYSEPGSGSDLGSLQTRATPDGSHHVISGQKIFSSNASIADHMLLAARTSSDATKHRGITLFLVAMNSPGIEVAPLWTFGGWKVNTIYIDGLRVPTSAIVGEVDRGWWGLTTALDIERSGFLYIGRCARVLDELRSCLPGREFQSELSAFGAEVHAARLLSYRVAAMQAAGRTPNVESSMAKLFATELLKRLTGRAVELLGHRSLETGSTGVAEGFFEEQLRWALMGTIVAGTSEIQRTIIARRGLGLGTARHATRTAS